MRCDYQACGYLPSRRASPPLAGTKLYCLVTEAHVCKQLAQGCTRQRGGRDSNPRHVDRKSSNLTTRPPANPVVKKIHHSRASGIPIGKWDSPRVFPLTCKRLFYHSIANRFTGRNSFIDIAESKPLERRKRFTMHSL